MVEASHRSILVPDVKRKAVNSIFLSLWFDPIGIEFESTISVENAPSTRSLIDRYMCALFFYTFRNQNDFHYLSAPQISNIFATFRYLNLCNRLYKPGKPVVRNWHGNFFRIVHLRTVIEWGTELRYGMFLEVRITEHHTVTYRSKPLESNDQSVPLHFTGHMTMVFWYIA